MLRNRKRQLRTIVNTALGACGGLLRERDWPNYVSELTLAPLYHAVSDAPLDHLSNLYSYRDVQTFRTDLQYLLQERKPLTLQELIGWVANGGHLPARRFFLSVDDGLREAYEVMAPILREYGIPATFFINTASLDNAAMLYRHKASLLAGTISRAKRPSLEQEVNRILTENGIECCDAVEGILDVPYGRASILDRIAGVVGLDFQEYLARCQPYVSSAQVSRLIAQGFTIGAHSIDHPLYSDLSLSEQIRQTAESLQVVTRNFGLPYRAFAFPFNDEGVPEVFYSSIQRDGVAEIMFGNSGFILSRRPPFVIQRICMEDVPYSARGVVNAARCKYLIRRFGQAARRLGAGGLRLGCPAAACTLGVSPENTMVTLM